MFTELLIFFKLESPLFPRTDDLSLFLFLAVEIQHKSFKL